MKTKEYDVSTKSGQRAYLQALEEAYALGFEEDETEEKSFLEGQIASLKFVLGLDNSRYMLSNGNIFYSSKS